MFYDKDVVCYDKYIGKKDLSSVLEICFLCLVPWNITLILSTSVLDLWFPNSKLDLVVLPWFLYTFFFLEIIFHSDSSFSWSLFIALIEINHSASLHVIFPKKNRTFLQALVHHSPNRIIELINTHINRLSRGLTVKLQKL